MKSFRVEGKLDWQHCDVCVTGRLMADSILTNITYFGSVTEGRKYVNSTITIFPNNYKYSNIRAFLNGTKNQYELDGNTPQTDDVDWSGKGFLQRAFTSTAQSLIKTTTVDNSAAATSDAAGTLGKSSSDYCCDDTEDKIYLLSQHEATDSTYGDRKSTRLNSSHQIISYAVFCLK